MKYIYAANSYGEAVAIVISNICKKHSVGATLRSCSFTKEEGHELGTLAAEIEFDPSLYIGVVCYRVALVTDPSGNDLLTMAKDIDGYLDMIVTEAKRELIMCQSEVDNKMIPLPVESFVSDESIVYVFREIESGKAKVGLFTDAVILSRGYFNDLQDALARDRKRNNENESTKGTD